MEIKESINYLKKLKSFKGIRHKLGYPCRGQRTHTNARTAKKLRNKF
jgi:small subunit ribosomal protein S13